jgi:hypothetical protein
MTRVTALVVLTVCLTASIAEAQVLNRWDAAGHVTWLGERRQNQPNQWDRWFGVASGGGSAGVYWTSHLKTELDISTSSEGEIYSYEQVVVPGIPAPIYIQRDREIRVTTASLGLSGQFFENAWFHPFIGTGIEITREREHVETIPPVVPPRGLPPFTVGVPQTETRVRYGARPYTATGFKVYVSERAFIRSDIRMSWSADGLAALAWRSGVGFDF